MPRPSLAWVDTSMGSSIMIQRRAPAGNQSPQHPAGGAPRNQWQDGRRQGRGKPRPYLHRFVCHAPAAEIRDAKVRRQSPVGARSTAPLGPKPFLRSGAGQAPPLPASVRMSRACGGNASMRVFQVTAIGISCAMFVNADAATSPFDSIAPGRVLQAWWVLPNHLPARPSATFRRLSGRDHDALEDRRHLPRGASCHS